MEQHIINALIDRERLCLSYLTKMNTDSALNQFLYTEMVKAEQERKLLQIQISKN